MSNEEIMCEINQASNGSLKSARENKLPSSKDCVLCDSTEQVSLGDLKNTRENKLSNSRE